MPENFEDKPGSEKKNLSDIQIPKHGEDFMPDFSKYISKEQEGYKELIEQTKLFLFSLMNAGNIKLINEEITRAKEQDYVDIIDYALDDLEKICQDKIKATGGKMPEIEEFYQEKMVMCTHILHFLIKFRAYEYYA